MNLVVVVVLINNWLFIFGRSFRNDGELFWHFTRKFFLIMVGWVFLVFLIRGILFFLVVFGWPVFFFLLVYYKFNKVFYRRVKKIVNNFVKDVVRDNKFHKSFKLKRPLWKLIFAERILLFIFLWEFRKLYAFVKLF